MNSVVKWHLGTQIVHCLLNIIHNTSHGGLDHYSFDIHDTYCTSALILNVTIAKFNYVSQMPGITLIILNQFWKFKDIKWYNLKKVQLAKLLFWIDTSELNLQNKVDLEETLWFCQSQRIFTAESQWEYSLL